MNKPLIVCFSQSKENLSNLICELHNIYGTSVELSIFQEKEALVNWLKSNKSAAFKTNLIIADFTEFNIHSIGLLNTINHYSPKAIKLIITENCHVGQIRKFGTNTQTLQFLSLPWTANDLNIAMRTASQTYPQLKPVAPKTRQSLLFNKKVEEKVNERLEKLIDANRAKDGFLSIIAHDLKNPFNAMLGISDILLSDWDNLSEDNKLEFIADIHQTSEETYKLLQTLLEWAKLQKEKLEVNINEIKIHNLVDSTIKVAESNAAVKGINVQNKIDDNLKVNADENMIATVFRNLITNAVQYTQPGGNIHISAKEEKDFYTFCVADNGSGIDKPHILEYFKRGNRKKLNGNASAFKGLGLILCKEFIERSGGQIWLETQKGQGSKFYFTLPSC